MPGSRKLIYLFVLLSLLVLPGVSYSWTAPADSPIGKKLHPRLFIIPQSYRASHPGAFGFTVSEIRAKLVSSLELKTNFQLLIDTMDGIYNTSPSSKLQVEVTYDAINFAFLYLMDPSVMSASPYNFNFQHTKDEYGTKAVSHAVYIAGKAVNETSFQNKGVGTWVDYTTYVSGGHDWYGVTNISLAVVNDWVFDKVTKSQRRTFMDGILNLYQLRPALTAFGSGAHFGLAENGSSGVLGFWGDSLDNSPSTTYADSMNTLMNSFYSDWIKGVKDLSNKVYDNGSSSVQGLYYGKIATKNMMPMVLIMSTALDTNYFSEIKYLRYMPYYFLFNTLPRSRAGLYFYHSTDDMKPYQTNVVSYNWGRYRLQFNPIIEGLKNDEPGLASLYAWYKDKSGFLQSENTSNKRIRQYMIYELLYDGRGVSAKSPSELNLPSSYRVGNGEYFLRTGFTSQSDTLITFGATKYHVNDGGHAHRDFGNFQIRKYGDLTTCRQVAKGFSGGNFMITQNSMWYNTIGVYKPGEVVLKKYNDMGYRSGYSDKEINPDATAYSVGGSNHVGTIKQDFVGDSRFDYIDYDYTNAWSSQKVSYAEREFLYLKSAGGVNDEYVVVFDRINSVQSSYTKYFLLQAAYEPSLLDNSLNKVTMTAENYPNDSDGKGGGRWVNKTSTPQSDNVIEITNTWNGSHGRLFNKTLSPSSFQINKTGGSGHYWEDAEGKLIWSGTFTNDEEKNYRGTYTMQVQATTGNKFDNFLNVMQIGDSDTLTSMTPVSKISATGKNGSMSGALIGDSTKNRIILFNPADPSVISKIQPRITYTVTTTAGSHHLLFNPTENTLYSVKRNGVLLTTVQSSGGGIVSFEDPGVGTNVVYQIDLAGSTLGEYPSEPDRQIEVETFTSPDKVRLRWYQSRDDDLAGSMDYRIYYDTGGAFSSPSVISNPVLTYEDTYSGRIYTASFSPVSGSQYFYKVASVDVASGKESSLDFVLPVAASFTTPSVSSFSVSDFSSGDTSLSDSTTVSVSASASDPQGAGTIVRWLITESPTAPSSSSMNTGSSSAPSVYTIKGPEGVVNFHLWVMDQDGNISQLSGASTANITLSIPPAGAANFKVN